jgi:type II secretory pathway pseudopilin PulG
MRKVQSAEVGSSLVEMLVVVSLIGMSAAISTAAMTTMVKRRDLRSAALHIRTLMQLNDTEGQTLGAYRGIRFSKVDEVWYYTVYEDGNKNGVLSADIAAGIDRVVQPSRPLLPTGSITRLGFPPGGVPDPDTRLPLLPGARPVQFGRSNLCSFSENGTCTAGSIYLTDGVSTTAAVRCSGATGRIHILYYGYEGARWTE